MTGPSDDSVRVEVSARIATVTLARPPVNALTGRMTWEIGRIVTELNARDDVAVAILTAQGDRVFCAGGDTAETERRHAHRELLEGETVADLADPGLGWRACFSGIRDGRLPMIAAVNGAAVGAGAMLVAGCDLVVLSETAWFGLPEIDVGILGGGRHLQRLVGAAAAREMVATGRRVPAGEVYRRGSAVDVVPADRLQDAARTLAREIAARGTPAVGSARLTLNRVEHRALEDPHPPTGPLPTRPRSLDDIVEYDAIGPAAARPPRSPAPPEQRSPSMDQPQDVRVEVSEGVATVTLARPPVNALSAPMMREIAAVFADLGRRTDAVVAVLTAEGDKIFCAGADIAESERRYTRRELLPSESVADLMDPGAVVRECFEGIRDGGLPVIAAVNGAAIGAGAALVACCDLVVLSDTAWFSLPEIDVGVLGGARHVQRLVGPFKAREMAYTGRRVPAAELYRLGAAVEVVAPEQLQKSARALASELAAKSPLALRMAKQAMNRVEHLSLEDGYRLEQDYTARVSRLDDAQEARAAHREKRTPRWSWR